MTRYDSAEAKAQLFKQLQTALLGEEVAIAQDRQPLLSLAPIEPIRAQRVPGSAKGKIVAIAPGFDDPLTDFQAYS
jgi:antitoxin (DNA-binding transcriptional repressor) of toxin-antitoxin stability system